MSADQPEALRLARDAFEAWARSNGWDLRRISYAQEFYSCSWAQHSWLAWQAATAAEREACALVCEAEHVGESVNDSCDNNGDAAYNRALQHAAAAIRARSK